jgi:hypothetical protein
MACLIKLSEPKLDPFYGGCFVVEAEFDDPQVGLVSNHLRRLRTKALVVSTEGKGLAWTKSGDRQEEDRKETTIEVSKA